MSDRALWARSSLAAVAAGVAIATLPAGGMVELGAVVILLGCVCSPTVYRPALPTPVVLLVGWGALTLLWSIQPAATARELPRLALSVAAGLALAATQEVRRVGAALTYAVGGIALACVARGVISPADSFRDGGLQGFLGHPNALGYSSALGVVAGSLILVASGWRGMALTDLLTLGLALLSNAAALALSGSMTSILSAAAGVIVAVIARGIGGTPRERQLHVLVFTLSSAVTIALVVIVNVTIAAGAVGKDTTLTGRTDIWAAVAQIGSGRAIEGYGLAAPWTPESWIRQGLDQQLGFSFTSSHNTVLDIFLELGVVGILLWCAAWLHALWRLSEAAWTVTVCWAVGVLVYHLLHGLAESTLPDHLQWCVLTYLWSLRFPARRGSRPGVAAAPVRPGLSREAASQ